MKIAQSFLPNPNILTILTTYQCTAACKQCCFESSPEIKGRLSIDVIKSRISEAVQEFSNLSLVVFSGGEAFLLKEDLYEAVNFCTKKNLQTRIVTNASWGKSITTARKIAQQLKISGLGEINISTGKDHQEWIPATSVINAAIALTGEYISTLITVEAGSEASSELSIIIENESIQKLLASKKLRLQTNAWMPFHKSADKRKQSLNLDEIKSGCKQIFGNVVVTPHDNISACCGLTLEHIPEMRLGSCSGSNMGELYRSQVDDFLKYWIHMDGPYTIIERVLEGASSELLEGVIHNCQACVILHKNKRIRDALSGGYKKFIPEVMTRFHLSNSMEKQLLQSSVNSLGEPNEAA